MNMTFSFDKKTVLVTGSASGIGFEIAQMFLKSKAQVIIWDFSKTALQEAKSKLAKWGTQASFFEVDVRDIHSCQKAALELEASIDILVNNAGITRDKTFRKMTSEEWQDVIDVNLTGVFNVTKAVFDRFNPTHQQNRIINISSIVAFFGNFGQSNYAASKAGVVALTKTWAREFARSGITVNAIAPGFIETAMTQQMPPEVKNKLVHQVPLQRLGLTSDIAQACLFLASEEAGYINGVTLQVDGGLVI